MSKTRMAAVPLFLSLLVAGAAPCTFAAAASRRSLLQANPLTSGSAPGDTPGPAGSGGTPSCGRPGGCPWLDPALPVAQRVQSLLAAMTPEQKKAQLSSDTLEGIPELGIPPFGWLTECLHGAKMGQAGTSGAPGSGNGATLYPQTLAMAATFDDALIEQMAAQVADELRALYNGLSAGDVPYYTSCSAPHVTIARDARWGRISETLGEDPLLNGNMGAAFTRGLQGNDSKYLKVAAITKHFIGYDFDRSGPDSSQNFNAEPAPEDMRDSFLPPFEAAVAAGSQGVMCSFNALNGVPTCASSELLNTTLRMQMGFQGFVMTDNRVLDTITTPEPRGLGFAGGDTRQAAAEVLLGGTDLFTKTAEPLDVSDVPSERLDEAAGRLLTARMRMGHFDPPASQPWAALGNATLGKPEHVTTARQVMVEGAVLLKNTGVLPLDPASLSKLALIGPFAANDTYLLGRIYGATAGPVATPLSALQAALPGVEVSFDNATAYRYTQENVQADAGRCEASDACILFLGTRINRLAPSFWEELPDNAYDALFEGEGKDRTSLLLEPNQAALWQELSAATTKPLIVVLVLGGGLDISDMQESERIGAILCAWLPGQHGALGIADLLLGKESPSGRLPLSWYKESYTQLEVTDLRMRASGDYPGRTYRYWRGDDPLYTFGHGLSYANFTYSSPAIAAAAAGSNLSAVVNVTVTHSGGSTIPASTAVLLFMRYLGPSGSALEFSPAASATIAASGCDPGADSTDLVQRLAAYARTSKLQPGASQQLSFQLPLLPSGSSQSSWAGFGDPQPPCGAYALRFGVDQPDLVAVELQP